MGIGRYISADNIGRPPTDISVGEKNDYFFLLKNMFRSRTDGTDISVPIICLLVTKMIAKEFPPLAHPEKERVGLQ